MSQDVSTGINRQLPQIIFQGTLGDNPLNFTAVIRILSDAPVYVRVPLSGVVNPLIKTRLRETGFWITQ